MPKATIQDIIVRKKKIPSPIVTEKEQFPPGGGSNLPPYERKYGEEETPPKRRLYVMAFIAVISFAFLLFALSMFFVSATITVYPKQKEILINKSVESSKSGGTGLAFDTVTLSAKESITAPLTGTKEIKKKATGIIIIYNAYSSKPQKLIKNTRFETTDGKIYRIDSSIIVPGESLVSGKTVPGSTETVVSADEAGEEYNIGKTDFTIPGFKGDARYSKFYARSKTDMEGGFIGTIYSLSDEDEASAKTTLRGRLSESLLNDARKNIPPDFILYEDAVFFDFSDIKTSGKEGEKTITVEETGKLYAVIIRRALLSKFIAESEISDLEGMPVSSPTLANLSLSIKNKELVDTSNINNLTFTIVGTTTIVWDFDKKSLVDNLLGKPRKNFHAILAGYPGIMRADLSLTPFWAQVLPKKLEEITVKTVVE
ncbi:MAG: hypothetical protein AAB756_01755 [Patescibacteria group bacterium]